MIISVAKFKSKDDEFLLAKLRRDITSITQIDAREIGAIKLDTLAALALYKFVLLMKFGVFISDKG